MSRPNEEIVAEIQSGVNVQDNMAELYENNKGLIFMYARKFKMDEGDIEELQQEAYFALKRAVDNYRPDMGKFSSFFTLILPHEFTKYIWRKQGISAVQYLYIGKCDKAIAEIRQERKTVTIEEIAKRTGLTPAQVENTSRARRFRNSVSLDKPVDTGEDGGELFYSDIMTDGTDVAEIVMEKVSRQQDAERLYKLIDSAPLNQREREIIYLIYYKNWSMIDIGRRFGISHQRIGQIHQTALKKLRAELRKI